MKNLLQTELPKRFTDAVSKLYVAFHSGELRKIDCKKCAVGNLVGGGEWWLVFMSSSLENLSKINYKAYVGEVKEKLDKTGYSPSELQIIEATFMDAEGGESKEAQFKGLCAVVEYLCALDNIPNVMDIKSLFEYENDSAKRELSEVFI